MLLGLGCLPVDNAEGDIIETVECRADTLIFSDIGRCQNDLVSNDHHCVGQLSAFHS